MKKILTILFFALFISSFAQEKNTSDKNLGKIQRVLDKNGKLEAEGLFDEQGEKSGQWSYYFDDGLLGATINYVNGIAEGESKNYYYRSGKLWNVGSYKDGKKVGVWKDYHRNEMIKNIGNYEDNRKIGEWKYYDQNGILSDLLQI